MADEPQNPTPQEPDPESAEDSSAGAADQGDLSPQDEIDALINSSRGIHPARTSARTEVPGSLIQPQEGATQPEAFSQADIDAAMAASGEDTASPDDASTDTASFGQSDIDALLNASSPASGDATNESGEFSQADIDAALQAATDAAPAVPVAETRLDSTGKPFDEEAAAMAAALAEAAAEEKASSPPPAPDPNAPAPQPLDLPDFSSAPSAGESQDISILRDVNLRVQVELGRTYMYIEDVLKLTEGSVVELDNLAGDPVDIVVNGRLVARGEVLVLSDNFCVRISEILTGAQNVAVA